MASQSSADDQKYDLAILRDIGWRFWDPIGLLKAGENWRSKPELADEYDDYLIEAWERLKRGYSTGDVIDYLVNIESKYIGLGIRPDTRARVLAVVLQLRATL